MFTLKLPQPDQRLEAAAEAIRKQIDRIIDAQNEAMDNEIQALVRDGVPLDRISVRHPYFAGGEPPYVWIE